MKNPITSEKASITRGVQPETIDHLKKSAKIGAVASTAVGIAFAVTSGLEQGPPTDQDLLNRGWTQDQIDDMKSSVAENLPKPENTQLNIDTGEFTEADQ